MGLRIVGKVGAVLTLMGSFLPWEREGDFISYLTYGIQFFPKTSDHGGVLVVLLTTAIVLLAFKPPRFVVNPRLWALVLASILMTTSIIFVLRWLIHYIASIGFLGAASMEVGLMGTTLGSALLLYSAILNYYQPGSQTLGK